MVEFDWEGFLREDEAGTARRGPEEGLAEGLAESLLGEGAPPPKQAAWILKRLCDLGRLDRARFLAAAVEEGLEKGAAAAGRLLSFVGGEEVGRVLRAEEPRALPGNPAMRRFRKAWAPKGGWAPESWLGELSARYAREGGTEALFAELLEALGAGAEEGLSAELAAAAAGGCPAGAGEAWRGLWAACCRVLPGGGRGSPRWKAAEALGSRADAGEVFSWLGAQPNWGAQYNTACEYFGERGPRAEGRLEYPEWVGEAYCGCVGCNAPTRTSEFLDPRARRGAPHLEDFAPELRAEFVRRIPRPALEWSREAWRREAAWDLDYSFGEWRGRQAVIARRRAELLGLAEAE